jgi:hypothetical protein
MNRPRSREPRRGQAWQVLRFHYASRNAFLQIHRAYEARVARHVEERGLPRERIKLDPEATKQLFDTHRLNALIDPSVLALREASHALFRDQDVAEPYDSKVSRIYHELSILREEHLSVRHFPKTGEAREFARLYREVSEYYPQRLRRVRDLFARGQKRLEELLPRFKDDAIVLRSAYLFREELWPENPRGGLGRFLEKMFAEGAAYGFLKVARSFYRAGFFRHAAECARMGVAAAGKEAQARTSRAQQIRESISELDRVAARAEAEDRALHEEEIA